MSEIIDLYARYSYAFDEGDGEAVARLFTVDGKFDRAGTDPVVGRESLAAFVNAAAGRGMRHIVSNILVEPTDSGARGQAYVLVLLVGGSEPAAFGRYDDEFVHTPEGWRIRVRRFTPFVSD